MLATLKRGLDRKSPWTWATWVYEAVLATANLSVEQEKTVFDACNVNPYPTCSWRWKMGVDPDAADLIIALVGLHGDDSVLASARELFAEKAPAALCRQWMPCRKWRRYPPPAPDLDIYFDLAELRGYHYHTGIVFAAYVPGHGQALANGGRYNDVGAVFGRARPATGFRHRPEGPDDPDARRGGGAWCH